MIESALALVAATFILVLIPGPNAALIAANTLRFGPWAGTVTVLGTTCGIAVQLLLIVAGMTALIEQAAQVLEIVKWIGVAYLIGLGLHTWRQPDSDLGAVEAQPAVFWRGFLIATLNPKTLLFNAAFLPQFVGSDAGVGQLLALTGLFLAVLLFGDMLWVAFADAGRRWFARFTDIRNRVTGVFLIAAGVVLATAKRDA